MKLRRILCYILILLLCSAANAQADAQDKGLSGIQLCSEVHAFLKKNSFSPSTQSLVVSGENVFPYNIIVTFSPEKNTSPDNLILVFFQEDLHKNQEIIKEALKQIREAKYPFTVTVLFAYGEKQIIEKVDMIYGSQVFLEGLNTNLSYTAVIFDLESKDNSIETTAAGLSSPPQLIKNSMNLYKSYGIGSKLPHIILSQLSSYKFITSRILKTFFDYEIPAIRLGLGAINSDKKTETAVKIIKESADAFSKSADTSWEHHFMIVELFGSYHTVSEIMILRIVVPVIFLWLCFIFMLIFVNRSLQRHTFNTIGRIWWSVPLTYLLLTAGFFISGFLFRNVFLNASWAAKIYGQLIFQICFSLFLTLSAYLIILNINYRFTERAIDYLLVISCFINQSVFILADISLSPIFIIICFLSLIALTVKNNYLHVAVFLLMITPLIPYGHRMINYAQLRELSTFLSDSLRINFIIPLVLYPVYLVLFRIITSVRTHHKKIRFVIISTSAAFVLISAALTCLGIIRTSQLNKEQTEGPKISVSSPESDFISLSVSDQSIFDDIVRTLDISLKKPCLLCDVLLTTESTSPVLYSDNDYTSPSGNSVRFRIPDNPPDEMTFSYGAAKVPCRITVSAVIQGSKEDEYLFISRSIDTGKN